MPSASSRTIAYVELQLFAQGGGGCMLPPGTQYIGYPYLIGDIYLSQSVDVEVLGFLELGTLEGTGGGQAASR